jgi:protocatechuate 3,4-dioxygenase beta subunit
MVPAMTSTRRQLLGAGAAAVGASVIGRDLLTGDGGDEVADAATPSCTLTPEVTQGPYYLDLDKVRRDITEGKHGLRLDLRIKVVDADNCKVHKHAAVEIWHADATGVYSGFSHEGTSGKTYLRGTQLTDEHGVARFRTIYPGWYQGRAIHIHMKVHVGGQTVHTGQLFFNDSVSDRVVRLSPYSSHQGTRLRNKADQIYGQAGGSGALLRLRRRKANSFRKGLIGSITVGIES